MPHLERLPESSEGSLQDLPKNLTPWTRDSLLERASLLALFQKR